MTDREGVPPEGGAPDRSNGDDSRAAGGDEAARSSPEPVEPAEPAEPAEPTLRADPEVREDRAEREFEVPFDTGELRSLPTGQLLVVHRPEQSAAASEALEEETQRRVYSWIAAVIGTIGAVASLFVGWMLPLSITAIVFGVLGLRREEEGRTLAFVGIGTGIAGLVFSAVWIGYYAIVFGALPR